MTLVVEVESTADGALPGVFRLLLLLLLLLLVLGLAGDTITFNCLGGM